MQALKGLALLLVTLALSGCLATIDGLAKTADGAFDKFSASTKAMIAEQIKTKPSEADEYASFAAAEMAIVKRLIAYQRSNGLGSSIVEHSITVRSKISPQKSRTVDIAASYRLELPSDAVTARHSLVLATIESVTEYVSIRQQQEPSRLVLVGRDQVETAWMKEAAEQTLAKLGVKGLAINTAISPRNAAVGWTSDGSLDRLL